MNGPIGLTSSLWSKRTLEESPKYMHAIRFSHLCDRKHTWESPKYMHSIIISVLCDLDISTLGNQQSTHTQEHKAKVRKFEMYNNIKIQKGSKVKGKR